MAVSQIEEKILGRLARQTADDNPLLSASLYQLLGLSILLSRKLYRARKLRRLDITRDTKSLQLYHHIIWLAREGLQITEVYILPYCQDGDQGAECQVIAAKLRASLYHVFCLFHNHPPIALLKPRSSSENSPESNSRSPKSKERASSKSPRQGRESSRRRRRASKQALRDPIPSMNSDTSYITNPYAGRQTVSPPEEARRTPARPPGLSPKDIAPAQAAASFLLPPLNFVPMATAYFETAQHLADSLLGAANALRLSISLEHSAFIWDCEKEHDKARKLARQAIKNVYASQDGLDDDEFINASTLVQALGGIVKRGSNDSTPRLATASPRTNHPSRSAPSPPVLPPMRTAPLIDRTIAVSPAGGRRRSSPAQVRSFTRTPERLSTVPEDPSQETSETAPTTLSPPISRLSSRSKQRRASSTSVGSDKASRRKAAEAAEALYQQNNQSNVLTAAVAAAAAATNDNTISQPHSRQNTPPDGYVRKPDAAAAGAAATEGAQPPPPSATNETDTTQRPRREAERAVAHERRRALRTALNIISAERPQERGHDVGVVF